MTLPDDLLYIVFDYVDEAWALIKLQRVSKQWCNVIRSITGTFKRVPFLEQQMGAASPELLVRRIEGFSRLNTGKFTDLGMRMRINLKDDAQARQHVKKLFARLPSLSIQNLWVEYDFENDADVVMMKQAFQEQIEKCAEESVEKMTSLRTIMVGTSDDSLTISMSQVFSNRRPVFISSPGPLWVWPHEESYRTIERMILSSKACERLHQQSFGEGAFGKLHTLVIQGGEIDYVVFPKLLSAAQESLTTLSIHSTYDKDFDLDEIAHNIFPTRAVTTTLLPNVHTISIGATVYTDKLFNRFDVQIPNVRNVILDFSMMGQIFMFMGARLFGAKVESLEVFSERQCYLRQSMHLLQSLQRFLLLCYIPDKKMMTDGDRYEYRYTPSKICDALDVLTAQTAIPIQHLELGIEDLTKLTSSLVQLVKARLERQGRQITNGPPIQSIMLHGLQGHKVKESDDAWMKENVSQWSVVYYADRDEYIKHYWARYDEAFSRCKQRPGHEPDSVSL